LTARCNLDLRRAPRSNAIVEWNEFAKSEAEPLTTRRQ